MNCCQIAHAPVLRYLCALLCILFFLPVAASARQATPFALVDASGPATIVYEAGSAQLDSIAAHLLADDIGRVTGKRPRVLTTLAGADKRVVVIGQVGSPLINEVAGGLADWLAPLSGAWERYGLRIVSKPLAGIDQALVIAGSDVRGTAYGVFAVSEKIGVSPWYWWADAPIQRKTTLSIQQAPFLATTPSVK